MFGENNYPQVDGENNHDGEDHDGGSSGSDIGGALGKFAGILLIIVFFIPGLLLAYGVHKLLTKVRLRLSVISMILVILNLIGITFWKLAGGFSETVDSLKSISLPAISDVLPTFISANIFVGSVLGFISCWWAARNLRKTPHLKQLEDTWTYQFEFRRTPFAWILRRRKIEDLKSGKYQSVEKAPLGITESIEDRIVYRYYSEAVRQTLVTGAAGSGKTMTIASLINNDIKTGKPILIIDFKNDPELSNNVAAWAADNNREFYHFCRGNPKDYGVADNPLGQCTYDPLITGSSGAKADMVLGMREYDTASAVYKANMQQLLQVIFNALEQVETADPAQRAQMMKIAPNIRWGSGGIEKLSSVVEGDNIRDLAIAVEGTPASKSMNEVADEVNGRTGLAHAKEELQGQLRTIVASHYGPWITTKDGYRNIDIGELTKPGSNGSKDQDSVVMFSIDSDEEPDFASYMGSLILSDITALSARRRAAGTKNHVNVYVDEFQAVPPESVMALIEKSRASNLGMTLSLQSFEQIIKASPTQGDAYLGSILDTCSNFIIHAGAVEKSATRLAEILGKKPQPVYRASNKNENFFLSFNWENRRKHNVQSSMEDKWIVSPQQFMDLEIPNSANGFKSTAMFLQKSLSDPAYSRKKGVTGGLARKVWMIPVAEVLRSNKDPEKAQQNYEDRIKNQTAEKVESSHDSQPESSEEPSFTEFSPVQKPLTKKKVPSKVDPEDEGDFSFSSIDESDEEDVYDSDLPPLKTRGRNENEFDSLMKDSNYIPESIGKKAKGPAKQLPKPLPRPAKKKD